MSIASNMIVLTPAVVGVILNIIQKHWLSCDNGSTIKEGEIRSFSYPSGVDSVMFVAALLVPLVTFLLPNSVVLDARPLFNVSAILISAILFWLWFYFKNYKIVVGDNYIESGAFRKRRRVELGSVTEIRYHWVNNGINLKLFDGKNRVAFLKEASPILTILQSAYIQDCQRLCL
jgi:hypothetical protein